MWQRKHVVFAARLRRRFCRPLASIEDGRPPGRRLCSARDAKTSYRFLMSHTGFFLCGLRPPGTAPPQTGIPHICAQIPVSSAFRPLLRAFRSTSLQVSSPSCCRLLPFGCSGYASYALPLCSIHGSPWTRSRQKGRNSPERLLRGDAGFLEKFPKISSPLRLHPRNACYTVTRKRKNP